MAIAERSEQRQRDQRAGQPRPDKDHTGRNHPITPRKTAWREEILTRAEELEWLSRWLWQPDPPDKARVLAEAIKLHLTAARQAAECENHWYRMPTRGSLLDRAKGNLYAAEVAFLNVAPCEYVLGLMPSLLAKVRRHLTRDDPRRQELERIACNLGIAAYPASNLDRKQQGSAGTDEHEHAKKVELNKERGKIIAAVRAASSACCLEHSMRRTGMTGRSSRSCPATRL